MKVPEVAGRLREIATARNIPELNFLADQLRRRPVQERAPRTSRSCTPEVRQQIKDFKLQNPSSTQREIARHFNVDEGRVSETLRGFRR